MAVAVVVASLNNKGEGWQSMDSQRAVAGCQLVERVEGEVERQKSPRL